MDRVEPANFRRAIRQWVSGAINGSDSSPFPHPGPAAGAPPHGPGRLAAAVKKINEDKHLIYS